MNPKFANARLLLSTTHDPWFNLATEEWIFREMDPSMQTLFLWQNANTVVIGRNQNPWSECNLQAMEKDGVKLARRTTGGGAVFHDLGNLCFTFLSPKQNYDRKRNSEVVLSGLRDLGVQGLESSGRNDLVVRFGPGDVRKFSGSAYREARDRAFHHGTVLLNADLERLGSYLTPHPKKLLSKGRASARARVINIAEVAPHIKAPQLIEALFKSFLISACDATPTSAELEEKIETLDASKLAQIPFLEAEHRKMASWEWRFGHAPQFQQSWAEYFSWGFVELHLDFDRGVIVQARLFSDALDSEIAGALDGALLQKPFSRAGLALAGAEAKARLPQAEAAIDEFILWLSAQAEL